MFGLITRVSGILILVLVACVQAGPSQSGQSGNLIDEYTQEQIVAYCKRPSPKVENHIGANWVLTGVYTKAKVDKHSTRMKSIPEHAAWGYLAHLNFSRRIGAEDLESTVKDEYKKLLFTPIEGRRVFVLPIYQENESSPKLYRWVVNSGSGTLNIVSTDPLEALVALEPESYRKICNGKQ